MAARDILTLQNDIAPRLVRIVYALALILITLGALAGVARGISRMVHVPQQRLGLAGRGPMGPGGMAMNQQGPAPAAGQPAAAPSAAADAPPSAAPSANAQPSAPQNGMMMDRRMGMGGMRDGMGRRGMMMGRRMGMGGMHRPGFGGHRFASRRFGGGPGLLGHLPPVAQGGLMILRALVMGAIGIMLARILAELAGAVLATKTRPA